ncbi:helix-turn-helix domain-containing protein [Thermodesulfitimonas sp.]
MGSEKEPDSELARRLKELQESRGLTRREVAQGAGIDYTAYNKYEAGLRGVKPDTLVRLADFYGVSVDYLLGREKSPNDAETIRRIRIREGIEMALRAAEIPEDAREEVARNIESIIEMTKKLRRKGGVNSGRPPRRCSPFSSRARQAFPST